MRLPFVQGANLQRKRIHRLGEFAGEINWMATAFQQWHQALVTSQVACLERLQRSVPGVLKARRARAGASRCSGIPRVPVEFKQTQETPRCSVEVG